ncbi:iron complex outermembrane recepter protein [Andreprevotia lacus DSM 23236]|jgi:iron complex outermembrane receptor protein|uniref:Iron complex outermembrane recepter protein n=1 Tax=Andreprevotia lacus DSM 23236 TaxID=1121001 RepID=A0A1W1XSS4_9NEIS|nr:TonB-dependent receptor [Andreprevotia lacus]SMC26601.1 iron complex outermembrane recepter protein [Andreprevotia lacus DSM 23236]
MFQLIQCRRLTPLAALCAALGAHAADLPVYNADPVIITASRVPSLQSTIPGSVTVITADDIAQSSASTVQGVLSSVAGIHFFSTSGSADGTIDLRGFGMTGSSNTLILVDGVKQNTNDLSSPKLAFLPLAAIARIEIVRGSGSVQYGGGTTGGVINIITRGPFEAADTVEATATVGSNNLRQLDLALHKATDSVGLDAYAQSMSTDHQRDNNAERRDNVGVNAAWQHEGGSINAYVRAGNQHLGLAGSRKIDPAKGIDEYASNPDGTSTPRDYSDVKNRSGGVQLKQDIGTGTLYAELALRGKQTESYYNSSWGDYFDKRDLREKSAALRYQLPFGNGQQVVAGIDWLGSDMDVDQGAVAVPSMKTGQRHTAVFAEASLQPFGDTRITVGARHAWLKDDVTDLSGYGTSSQTDQGLNAWQLGVRQPLGAGFAAYAKVGRSYRLANADELVYTSNPLKPQTSNDKEIGLAWDGKDASAQLAYYRYDLDNEIYYSPLANFGYGANVNLDPTRREGIELSGRYAVNASVTISGNLSWQRATFRDGTVSGIALAGNQVPMVPEWLANAAVAWQVREGSQLAFNLQYVGEQRLDNDQANQFGTKQSSYALFGAKYTQRLSKNWDAALTVDNLFDKKYASYGIRAGSTGTTGAYSLYPAEGRSFMASLTAHF